MPTAMHVDELRLRQVVLTYLKSEAGRELLRKFGTTWIHALIFSAVAFVLAIFAIISIIFFVPGIRLMQCVFSGEFFRGIGRDFSHRPAELFPLIALGVMIGPDRKAALALGSFRPHGQQDFVRMSKLAQLLFEIYVGSGDGARPEHQAMRALMQADSYVPHRRRRVPEPYAQGMDLLLFDVWLQDEIETCETPLGHVAMSFVADIGKPEDEGLAGEINSIPWSVVAPAVYFNGVRSGGAPENAEFIVAETIEPPTAPASWQIRWTVYACVLAVLLLPVMCCGCVAFVAPHAHQEERAEVISVFGHHPVIERELGSIEQCNYNFFHDVMHGDSDHTAFQVSGPRGKGTLLVRERWDKYESIILVTPNGRFDLLEKAME
jgi:hypothetical protein